MNLDKSYNRSDFLRFIKSFIPDFKFDITRVDEEGLKVSSDVSRLGESSNLDLDVFELSHSASSNARITLASDGFRIMKNAACYRALIVYKAEDNQDWRLSLLTATPINKNGKVRQEYSNPRRYSFFLGPNAKPKTPYKFLIEKGTINDFEDLKSRFSVEVVNKEFYQHISTSYMKLVGGLIGNGKKQIQYTPVMSLPSQEPHSQTSVEFAVRLIGRIIFCWFLREKKSQSGKSLIPEELLSLEAVKDNPDYYHKVLEPIFFEVLNKPINSRKEKHREKPFFLISYLNGGLFSPQKDDFFDSFNEEKQAINHNIVMVPDKWFLELFEILETYNFTIDENTSFDEELSIDPEMLGRVFENLLAEINPETGESARKSTGSYYTPRVIVDYMINESLIAYLNNKTRIDISVLQNLVDYDFSGSKNRLSQLDNKNIVKALEELKLIDPACGSGAFPIGAMQKVVFILQQIDPDGQLWLEKQLKSLSPELRRVVKREQERLNFNYIRKLGIIRNNIYGIDIQPIATEISRLRCFLTLIVEQSIDDIEDNRNIQPLPNLEFKFVTANSLISLPKQNVSADKPNQLEMFDNRENINELKYIREQYFTASGIEREQLKTEFASVQKKLIDQLIAEHGFIGIEKAELTQKLYQWEPFSHKTSDWFDSEWMFGVKNGFDIVIGNPPYVDSENMLKDPNNLRDTYNSIFLTARGNWDLFIIFIERGDQLLCQNGILTYIVKNSLTGAKYSESLRSYLLNRDIRFIRDYSMINVFKEQSVYPIVFSFAKQVQKSDYVNVTRMITIENCSLSNNIPQETFYEDIYWDRYFVDEKSLDLLLKISKFPKLIEFNNEIFGAATVNEAYKLKEIIRELNNESPSRYKKLINTGTIDPYKSLWGIKDTRYIKSSYSQPIVENNQLKLLLPTRFKQAECSKLIIGGMNKSLEAVYDDGKYLAGKSTTILLDNGNLDIYFLLGLLNSNLISFWYRSYFRSLRLQGGYLRIGNNEIKKIPISNGEPDVCKKISIFARELTLFSLV